jgi:hypothetical protein
MGLSLHRDRPGSSRGFQRVPGLFLLAETSGHQTGSPAGLRLGPGLGEAGQG